MKNYNEMTVPELREECRSRGIPRQENGKKLTKNQLVVRLMNSDSEKWEGQEETKEQKSPVVEETKESVSAQHEEKEEKIDVTETEERISYDRDIYPKIRDVIDKYMGACSPEDVVPGARVAYVRYIETRSGKFLRKIGTALVVNTKRASRVAKIETPLGTDVQNFDDFLFVRKSEYDRYPEDIIEVLALQRKERQQFIERKYRYNKR